MEKMKERKVKYMIQNSIKRVLIKKRDKNSIKHTKGTKETDECREGLAE